MKSYAEAAKLVLAILIAVALGFGLYKVKSAYDELVELRAENTDLKAVATGTSAGIAAADRGREAEAEQETVTSDRRGRLDRKYEELDREDPTVAAWGPVPIPVVLRDADAAERHGPADSALGRERADGAAEAGGADPVSR